MDNTYTIMPLETPDRLISDKIDTALSINDFGHVTGYTGSPEDGRVFLYNGFWTSILNEFKSLHGIPYSINSLGHIVGSMMLAEDRFDQHSAFFFDGATIKVVDPLMQSNSLAVDVNNHAQALIQCGGAAAFIYESSTFHPIGAPDLYRIQAHGINDFGQTVGWSASLKQDALHGYAFVFDGQKIHQLGALDLGTGRKRGSSAWGINNHGIIVGMSGELRGPVHAFIYDDKGMHDLGTIENRFSKALAINSSGDVVGYAWHTGHNKRDARALLWHNRQIFDLNTLISEPYWLLRIAVDINDAGQIVGWGEFHGQLQVFLMSPVSVQAETE